MPTVLDEAAATIIDRGETHGDVGENQLLTSILWSAYLAAGPGPNLQPHDVAVLNILQKISRLRCGRPDRDHFVDIAGYAEIAVRLTEADS
tara:strand:- start:65 stop:337 length:273 start_codon:yes stop_codon:yes gene_type:complete